MAELAFKAVDEDESNSLEQWELARTIKDAAYFNGVRQPGEADIETIVRDIDIKSNGSIGSAEFAKLIINVFDKMMEQEDELIQRIREEELNQN